MGKTAGCSPARDRRALGGEHPAILPWLYLPLVMRRYAAAFEPREAGLPARN
ncbi:MAG TPA: hypothetical protein VEH75_00045 [Xanthobacteraceae bacterium]|nr:hypothetical protein [Xanthobacteraceae bacterium]